LGWAVAGSCDGSIGPTASPSFDKLAPFATLSGCPAEYSSSNKNYEAGDYVALTVSNSPLRQIVYECKAWPASGYCNNGGTMAPGEYYGNMGWTLKGSCSGSLAPTDAPAVYSGTCTFIKCTEDVPCTKDDPSNGVSGSTACSCTTGGEETSSCGGSSGSPSSTGGTQKNCFDTPVSSWSSSTSYDFADVVRIGTQRFKCKYWPNGLWCNNAAYKPEIEAGGIWGNAWTKDGTCT
jgi:hypothetical protein